MSASNEIREAFLAGEKLSADDMESFGVGRTVLSQIRSNMSKLGHSFSKEKVDGVIYWYIADSKTVSDDETVPMPALMEQLQVSALSLDRKGRLSMTLRSNKHSWRVTVDGVASK